MQQLWYSIWYLQASAGVACWLSRRASSAVAVAVTRNESLALSIMSAQLDKSLYFQCIGLITSNRARKKKSDVKKKKK